MRLTEVEKDLFSVDPQYSLAHCISADFALGAGIAKQFDTRFNMRYELFEKYGSYHFTGGRCLKIGSVFNLVTKDKCWQKPTYKALREALEDMKKQVVTLKIKSLPSIILSMTFTFFIIFEKFIKTSKKIRSIKTPYL